MKELLLKLAKVKNEKEFYKKYPTQEAFFKAHPEAKEIIAQYQQEMMANSQEEMQGNPEASMEKMAQGGLIRRADGSYSQRGLWDNIRANKGSGKKPTKEMLEQAKKIQAEEMMYGGMIDEYGNGGYTVRRSNDRKGKTHVVTGPDGTKKYFGDPNMGERSKSKHGKEAFYARHKTNLKNNPYFRAYARSTWEDGGILPDMQQLMLAGQDMYNMGGYVEYPTMYPGGGMIAGPMMGYVDNFNYAMGGRMYEQGGMINSMTQGIPVQTETFEGQAEQVALPDGTIKSVDATTTHENMSDGEVTDVLPGGSHIQSARNKLTTDQYAQLMQMFNPESAEQDIKKLSQVYQNKYGKKNGKKLSPADISEYAKNKYQTKSTPNAFDTDKLKEGNKKAYLELSMQMNDLIKSGKEIAEGKMPEQTPMMAWGGNVNKYVGGGEIDTFLSQLLTPETTNLIKNTTFDESRGKYRLNMEPNMSLQEKMGLADAAERFGINNLVQGRNKDFPNFVGGFTPQDFEKRIVYANEGPKGLENKSDLEIRKKALNLMGYKGNLSDTQLSDVKSLYNDPRFKEIYSSFTNYLPSDKFRKTRGNDFMMGAEHFDALGNYVEPQPITATPAIIAQTPGEKVAGPQLGATTPVSPAARIPMQNRFNFGLLEGQLGRGLQGNQAYLNAAMSLSPVYTMETPDTFIRSRRNEIPIGNILYNIERAQRNSANALANQTGDWSTLAGNIANAGAQAYNQIGDTLSALNEKNLGLYNTTQDLQQNLLSSNVGVRNQNLTNMQNMMNYKRNLSGQKAVKDAELYSKYVKSMSENSQEEQNQKLAMLNIMASKPDMFKGEQGQRFANQIMGNYGSYNNPFAGSVLDFGLSNLFK
jgi:hypothetical protein